MPYPAARPSICDSARSGFTLLELLLALAVLSVVTAVVVPGFLSSYLQHRATDAAINSVIDTVLLAKQQAILSSVPYVYELDQRSQIQTIYPIDQSKTKRSFEVDDSIRLQLVGPNGQDQQQIVLHADGHSDSFSIRIIGPSRTEVVKLQRHLGIPQRTIARDTTSTGVRP